MLLSKSLLRLPSNKVLEEWATIRPDLDMSPVGVIARMARIRAIIDVEQARIFGAAGITSADFPVLVTLRRRQPPYRATHTQVAADLALTAGTVSARVDRLVALSLVRRQVDDGDARVGLRWPFMGRWGVVEDDLAAGAMGI
jgi:hypothetical protein